LRIPASHLLLLLLLLLLLNLRHPDLHLPHFLPICGGNLRF
jgi:hypothetical protein